MANNSTERTQMTSKNVESSETKIYRAKMFQNMIMVGVITVFLMGISHFAVDYLFSSASKPPKSQTQILFTKE